MNFSDHFFNDFDPFGPDLQSVARKVLNHSNAKLDDLTALLERLPEIEPSSTALDRKWVTIGTSSDLSGEHADQLMKAALELKPWRKGPFDFFGIRIDSEWDSDMKWRRIVDHIKPLHGRKILDVGSSNGYYLFRMAAYQPRCILGIEPYLLYYYQYLILQRYLDLPGCYSLPFKLEDLPVMEGWFDTLFCMGILYHRRSPLDTLIHLKRMLSKGGQLILETLIIAGDDETAFFPSSRYARMRNVFFLPTVRCLKSWLSRCGFHDIRCVDTTPTTFAEQRKTQWIDSESLESFLDPENSELTIEGYPAPVRTVIIAEA